MITVGYFFSKYIEDDSLSLLNVDKWKDAYKLFYNKLGDGRKYRQFERSLKNSRDAFDSHIENSRRGWFELDRKTPKPLTGKTLEVFEEKTIPTFSLVECKLETGRTHQIRVHMSYNGNHILGDKKYKKKFKKLKNINKIIQEKITKLDRQFLHAKILGFIHPKKKEEMIFNSILPQELENILKMLRKLSK